MSACAWVLVRTIALCNSSFDKCADELDHYKRRQLLLRLGCGLKGAVNSVKIRIITSTASDEFKAVVGSLPPTLTAVGSRLMVWVTCYASAKGESQ